MIKKLSILGIQGRSNQYGSNGAEGTANINLGSLGAGRSLVLINGQRHTFNPYPIVDQQRLYVNTQDMPDMLQEGAAAIDGSDAVAGVVNFTTRSDFEGLEVKTDYTPLQDSHGDYGLGLIWGLASENPHCWGLVFIKNIQLLLRLQVNYKFPAIIIWQQIIKGPKRGCV